MKSMQSEEKCVQCDTKFTHDNIARLIPDCGHNICNNCVKLLTESRGGNLKCGKCKKSYQVNQEDVDNFPKNITIIKQIRQSSISLSMASTDKIDKRISNSEDTDINSGSILLNQLSRDANFICQKHGKPLEIICIVDKGLLCAHCAIFGEHRDHQFKTIQQFEGQLNLYQKSLKQISGRKKNADNRIKGQNYKTEVVKQITKKKDQLIKQIKQKFSKLIEYIKTAQQKIYDQLVSAFRGIDSEINRMTKEQNKLQTYYQSWKRQAYDYLNKIQHNNQLMSKIHLFYGDKLPNLKEGEGLVSEIQDKNVGINDTIKTMIDSIHMEYSVSMEGYIYNYARVVADSADLTVKTMDLTPKAKSIEKNQLKKRPIKMEFVSSDAFSNSANPSLISPKGNRPKNVKSKSPQLYTVRSNPKNIRTTQILSPKKTLTPKKSLNSNKKVKTTQNFHTSNLQFAERMLNEFKSSTDTFDITGCELGDNEIVYLIELASSQKPIKCLKLSKNKLTTLGLRQTLKNLPYTTSINLSHNSLTDDSLDEIIKNKQYLTNLRIVNVSHNKLNQRKIKSNIEQLKRLGIIVTL